MAKQLTEDHKAALEAGRVAGRAIKAYLTHLEAGSQKKRQRPEQTIRRDLAEVEAGLETAGPVQKISLIQRRLDLQEELETHQENDDEAALEAAFIEHLAEYSARKGLSYQAWREFGVPARVLRAGGLAN